MRFCGLQLKYKLTVDIYVIYMMVLSKWPLFLVKYTQSLEFIVFIALQITSLK